MEQAQGNIVGQSVFTASNGGQRELSTEHKGRDNNLEIKKI